MAFLDKTGLERLWLHIVSKTNEVLTSAKSYTDTEITEWVGDNSVADQISNAISTKSDTGHTHDDRYYTETEIDAAIGVKANASDLTAHTGNKSNPHGVTLSQLGVTATSAELNYVDGVTGNVQTQLNAKVPTSRKVNGKDLSSDITLSASDVGADASGAANTALTNAKAYTDQQIDSFVGDTPVATQIAESLGGLPQPDWSQNDPNAKDYVKNRTHWVEYIGESVTLINNVAIEISNTWLETSLNLELTEGSSYIVTWDGVEYRCVAFIDDYGDVDIGNGIAFGYEGGGNGEPFLVCLDEGTVWVAAQVSGSHTLSIRTDPAIFHKIDSEYLPAEFNYLSGVTSNIQNQLDNRAYYSHSHSASAISAGTFTGTVKAKTSAQAPSTSLLRNSKIVTTSTNPSYNGEIYWVYE